MENIDNKQDTKYHLLGKLSIGGIIDRFFHKCDFNTIEIPVSNQKGEIWIQECKCGNKQKVLFDDKGICRDIQSL